METKEEIAKNAALIILPHDTLYTRTKIILQAMENYERVKYGGLPPTEETNGK